LGPPLTLLAATDYVADGALWFAHIQALAGDEMQGREMSSKEFRKRPLSMLPLSLKPWA